jgi:rhodanese-related sulfurtransferase
MARKHSPAFEKICEDAKSRIREISVSDVCSALKSGPDFILIDIREDHEWNEDFITGATHLGRGIIERDIEEMIPDMSTRVVLYCGGGYRSALAAEALQKMGYTNVLSMAGGIRAWKECNYSISKREST